MKKQSKWVLTIGVVGLALVLVASSGCHRKPKSIQTNMTGQTSGTTGTTSNAQPGLTAEQLMGKDFPPIPGVNSIYFDFDRSDLRPDAMDTLKKNADVIKASPGLLVRIAGNCDERGTQEYNLALGEKRALAARNYLMQLGVPADRLITISYGKENPVDPGHDEAAWAKNRRDDFGGSAQPK